MKAPQLAHYLVLLTSALLVYFGLGTLINLGSHPELAGIFIFYAFAMFIESAVLLFCYFRLKKRSKKVFWLAIIILALNIILTIFDQVGFIDILYMLLNLVALATLYLARKDFLPE
jgi:lysylphosphatidylglycerol synthetase-like protein (DUF2156 family)